MHPLIELKGATSVFLVVLACLMLSPAITAVNPPPDGSYLGANTAEGGSGTLFSLTTGTNNTAIGSQALFSLTTGQQNTAVGSQALKNNRANENTATGFQALALTTTGFGNAATGFRALVGNTTGFHNSADGFSALLRNTTGNHNTATGDEALGTNTSGSFNTTDGAHSLENNTTGTGNTALGFGAGGNVTTANNVICIGANVTGTNISNTCFIGNIRGVTTGNPNALPVLIDSAGQLGTLSSSRRFKKEITPMEKASEAILSLKPVMFHYKSDKTSTAQFGLIAEDVAAVNPDLVVRDKDGEIYTVRYDAVNAMLLNEFLKEHRKVEEQGDKMQTQEATIVELKSTVEQQQKQIETLSAGLQKVSAQLAAASPSRGRLDVDNSASQIVLNSQ
jgi:uncharacterized coiled-coil protein SlyX